MKKLVEKRWQYQISKPVAAKLRTAIDREDYNNIREALKMAYKEIFKMIPDYFDEDDYESTIMDIDDIESDEEKDWDIVLNDFYDFCDNLNIWIPIEAEPDDDEDMDDFFSRKSQELGESVIKRASKGNSLNESANDGWDEDLDTYLLTDLEQLIYEIRNCYKGAYTHCKTYDQLAEYVRGLADKLTDYSFDISSHEDEDDEEDEDLGESLTEGATSDLDQDVHDAGGDEEYLKKSFNELIELVSDHLLDTNESSNEGAKGTNRVNEGIFDGYKDYSVVLKCNDGPTIVVRTIAASEEEAIDFAKSMYAQEHTTYADDRANKWSIKSLNNENKKNNRKCSLKEEYIDVRRLDALIDDALAEAGDLNFDDKGYDHERLEKIIDNLMFNNDLYDYEDYVRSRVEKRYQYYVTHKLREDLDDDTDKILLEGRDAPLYHVTSFNSFISILKSDTLKTGRMYAKDLKRGHGVISLSRSYNFASEFPGQVILHLNQTKLSYNYKLTPVSDSANRDNIVSRNVATQSKAEESIDRDITDLHNYLLKVEIYTDSVSQSDLDEHIDLFKEYSTEYNVPIYVDGVMITDKNESLTEDLEDNKDDVDDIQIINENDMILSEERPVSYLREVQEALSKQAAEQQKSACQQADDEECTMDLSSYDDVDDIKIV